MSLKDYLSHLRHSHGLWIAGFLLGAGLGCSAQRPPVSGTLISVPRVAFSPWELTDDMRSTQRLYRVRFEGKDGDGRFRLVLRMVDRERFQLRATDPLGRSVWTLHADRGESIFLDHRRKNFCSFGPRVDFTELYLGSFPARDLPALILGRVPAAPEGSPHWSSHEDSGAQELEFMDGEARRWVCYLDQGRLVGWSLFSAGGNQLASLEQKGAELLLADRRRGLEVRWREVAAEPLRGPFEAPSVPQSYRREPCLGEAEER